MVEPTLSSPECITFDPWWLWSLQSRLQSGASVSSPLSQIYQLGQALLAPVSAEWRHMTDVRSKLPPDSISPLSLLQKGLSMPSSCESSLADQGNFRSVQSNPRSVRLIESLFSPIDQSIPGLVEDPVQSLSLSEFRPVSAISRVQATKPQTPECLGIINCVCLNFVSDNCHP